MAIQYKIDIMAELKNKGYSSTRIREEKLIGQSYLQQIRHGELVSWKTLILSVRSWIVRWATWSSMWMNRMFRKRDKLYLEQKSAL